MTRWGVLGGAVRVSSTCRGRHNCRFAVLPSESAVAGACERSVVSSCSFRVNAISVASTILIIRTVCGGKAIVSPDFVNHLFTHCGRSVVAPSRLLDGKREICCVNCVRDIIDRLSSWSPSNLNDTLNYKTGWQLD